MKMDNLYDYNDTNLDCIVFEDAVDLADCVIDDLDNMNEYGSIGIIAKYDDAVDIIKMLIELGDNIFPHQIELEPEEWDGYNKEYFICVDTDGELWCEKAYRGNDLGYIKYYSDEVIYIHGDCYSSCYINSEINRDYGEFIEFEWEYEIDEELKVAENLFDIENILDKLDELNEWDYRDLNDNEYDDLDDLDDLDDCETISDSDEDSDEEYELDEEYNECDNCERCCCDCDKYNDKEVKFINNTLIYNYGTLLISITPIDFDGDFFSCDLCIRDKDSFRSIHTTTCSSAEYEEVKEKREQWINMYKR